MWQIHGRSGLYSMDFVILLVIFWPRNLRNGLFWAVVQFFTMNLLIIKLQIKTFKKYGQQIGRISDNDNSVTFVTLNSQMNYHHLKLTLFYKICAALHVALFIPTCSANNLPSMEIHNVCLLQIIQWGPSLSWAFCKVIKASPMSQFNAYMSFK
jgi:hypothetical protein